MHARVFGKQTKKNLLIMLLERIKYFIIESLVFRWKQMMMILTIILQSISKLIE